MPASISTSQMTRRCSSRALGRWCLRRKLNATRQLAEQCRGRRPSGLTVTGAPQLAQVIEVGRAVGIALIPPAYMVAPDYANSIASKGLEGRDETRAEDRGAARARKTASARPGSPSDGSAASTATAGLVARPCADFSDRARAWRWSLATCSRGSCDFGRRGVKPSVRDMDARASPPRIRPPPIPVVSRPPTQGRRLAA
jgi:hypothetical protein